MLGCVFYWSIFFFSKSESIEDYFGTLTVVHFESLIFFRCFLAVDQDCYSVWYFFLLLMVNTCEINLKIRHKSLIHTMSKARRQISLPGDQFYVWTNLKCWKISISHTWTHIFTYTFAVSHTLKQFRYTSVSFVTITFVIINKLVTIATNEQAVCHFKNVPSWF